MAVPNTNTFTLQNVVDEINPTTDDLVDCFSDAIATKFDGTYSEDKDELLNFRNYNASLTSYSSSSGQATTFEICDTFLTQTYYHNGSGNIPTTGDACYTNSGGTTYLAAKYYKVSASTYIKITNPTGNVAEIFACGDP